MAVITLTDRVSVHVTAKNQTETDNQNKTNGNNLAKSLTGDSDKTLSDETAKTVGAALGDTVTGENGKQYAKIHGVANAIKAAINSGEIEATETHEGITKDGVLYNVVNPVLAVAGGPFQKEQYVNSKSGVYEVTGSITGALYYNVGNNNSLYAKDTTPVLSWHYRTWTSVDPNTYVQDSEGSRTPGTTKTSDVFNKNFYMLNCGNVAIDMNTGNNFTMYGVDMSIVSDDYVALGPDGEAADLNDWYAFFNGTVRSSGGSKIDTTKTDDEIANDIESAARQTGNIQTIGTDTYVAITDANGNPMYFLGT